MPILSKLRPVICKIVPNNAKTIVPFRSMSAVHARTLQIQPTRWQWNRFKDLLHFYIMLGAIPVAAIVTYVNIFIGPAQLSDIPEDYTPKFWEYYSHPITRFLARYIMHNPQQEYEKFMHYLYEEDQIKRLRLLENEVKAKMMERNDYRSYYFQPVMAKYVRKARETAEYLDSIRGN